jgi:hypothetical protein
MTELQLFIGCDLDECHELFGQLFPPPAAHDRHVQLLEKTLAFSLMEGASKEKA